MCPKQCVIEPGQSGDCRIRVNLGGKLAAVTYGHPCSAHVDPVEKKPLFHFLPGTPILSIATVGCNLHCKNCQNWEISQENPENVLAEEAPPDAIVQAAQERRCPSIAYTYTEPLVYYEYTLDTSIKAREAGIKNALVTAGYINKEPLEKLCRYTDAATVDIKCIRDDFYRDICSGTVKPVQNALVTMKTLGLHVEVSNLVIPTLNDSDADLQNLCRWVAESMGKETPFHFLQFFPRYRMTNLPPTPAETLERARDIAKSEGLHFVYIGNLLLKDGENTFCPQCKKLLVERRGHMVLQNNVREGRCPECKTKIYGVWS